MKVDLEQVKRQYEAMPDEEFRAVRRRDLTETARECYDQELARRDPERLQAVQSEDARYVERLARSEREDAKDPEPKPRLHMWLAVIVAGLTTAIVLVIVVIRLQNEAPVPTQPLLVMGGSWFSVWLLCVPHLRAKFEWKERRRKAGLL